MPPDTHTPLRNFRCDDERWDAFLAAVEEDGTTASKQIRDMIDIWLEVTRPPPRDREGS